MRTISFKKIRLGEWQRYDGEFSKIVNEESLFREIAKLVNDGWKMEVLSEMKLHRRTIKLTKEVNHG